MPKYEVRIKINGKFVKEIIEAPNVTIARKMAESRTGGKAVGSRQVK
tara:strand:- start:124 stop:264 length:141 start_codon:yes stop_codon:yes gene_type:complete